MEDIIKVLGKSIRDKDAVLFLQTYQIKYPKKNTARYDSETRKSGLHLTNEILGIEVVLNIEINNLDYPPIPAERKGSYVFRISGVFCSKQNSQFKFPIHFNDSYKQLETQLSDISNLWLNNDGSESFYSWHKVIDSPKGVQQYIEYNTNSKQVETVQTTIVENEILFILFDPLAKESINNFITSPERLATLGFVYWPIENQLFRASLQQKALAQKALNDVNTLVAFITQNFLNGYIYVAHFCTEQNFIKEYIHNLSDYDIVYQRDIAHVYLNEKNLFNNYQIDKAQEALKNIPINLKTIEAITKMINKRFIEFKTLQFANSSLTAY